MMHLSPLAPVGPPAPMPAPAVQPPVGAAPAAAPTGNVLIAKMNVQADLSTHAGMARGAERRQAVYDDLMTTARTSQADALAKLDVLKESGQVTAVESMFLPNAILITTSPGAHQSVADALAGVANISKVSENRAWSVDSVSDQFSPGDQGAAAGAAFLSYAKQMVGGGGLSGAAVDVPSPSPEGPKAEWGVEKIGAPGAWASGYDGSGVTIGIIDTGLDAQHAAIKSHYRGTQADGSQVHDYNWFDGISGKDTPYDDGDHGTHVAGTSAGGTDARAIGVAPGAKLVAAKAINRAGYNTTDATLRALQFMLAPTRTDGSDADPSKGVDVINNSWGQSVDQFDDTFLDSFKALKAAGIELVTAAGNDGPREGTVSAPGAYPGYISVAASSSKDSVAAFSSRGPSKFVEPGEMTPNITAPGVDTVSALPGGSFGRMSGTSMASPHAAGAVAILLQAKPQATHDEIVSALTSTAVDIDRPGPDNASGFGRIDVLRAVEQLTGASSAPVETPAAA